MSKHQWVKFYKTGWIVAQHFGDGFYIPGKKDPFDLCGNRWAGRCTMLEEWGPVINPPIEISHTTKKQTSSTIEECSVEKAAVSENKEASIIFDPTYTIDNFIYVGSQRDNDCAVVALANVVSLPYTQAVVECFRYGWSSTKGISFGFLELALEKLGFEIASRTKDFLTLSPAGVFLVYTKTHVMPYVNKILYNRCDNIYITSVTEVRPFVGDNQ